MFNMSRNIECCRRVGGWMDERIDWSGSGRKVWWYLTGLCLKHCWVVGLIDLVSLKIEIVEAE